MRFNSRHYQGSKTRLRAQVIIIGRLTTGQLNIRHPKSQQNAIHTIKDKTYLYNQ